jgi:hypothetical protein
MTNSWVFNTLYVYFIFYTLKVTLVNKNYYPKFLSNINLFILYLNNVWHFNLQAESTKIHYEAQISQLTEELSALQMVCEKSTLMTPSIAHLKGKNKCYWPFLHSECQCHFWFL